MAVTGMSAVGPNGVLNQVGDPDASALRIVPVAIQPGIDYISGYLISGRNTTGTAQAVDARGYVGAGYAQWWSSGNSASASILASYDSASWMLVSGMGIAVNGSGIAQLSGNYPYLAGRVDNAYNNSWGASAITARVTLFVTKA